MSTATFLKSDSTTNGTWYNGSTTVYGADGFGIADAQNSAVGGTGTPVFSGNPNWPAYATVTVTSSGPFNWSNSTSDARGLEYSPVGTSTGSDTKRIASAWHSSGGDSSFTIDIQDGSLHQVALYFLDWDDSGGGRSEQIQITDDNNGNAVLDTRSISNFSTSGIWLVWTVSGKVTFTITSTNANANAVVSGIFFDPAPATPAVFPPFVSRPRFEPAFYE